MRLLLVIVLIFILHGFVIGKSVVKRQCNSCCSECTSNCNNCCTSNNCRSNCNNNCQNCGNNCKECPSKNCSDDSEPAPVLVPFPPAEIKEPLSSGIASNNTNINKYNFTADITLTNTIHTVNNISIPIHINSTNENKVYVYPSTSNYSVNPPVINDKCCIVVYPRTCDSTGCYIRRQRECSSICTSDVVIIPVPTVTPPPPPPPTPTAPCPTTPPCPAPQPCPQPNPPPPPPQPCPVVQGPCPQQNLQSSPCQWNTPVPQPLPQFLPQHVQQPLPQLSTYVTRQTANMPTWIQPQQYIPPYPFIPQQQSNCQLGATYPFYQCGQNYQSTNCAGCYFCNGMYNPQQCAFSPECPLQCRQRR